MAQFIPKFPVLAQKVNENAFFPSYATFGSSGMDLHACLDAPLVIEPGKRVLIPIGITLVLPEGFEAQIRPRSGLALKHGITVLNSPGTIDSDYRGEIKVILINHGEENFVVTHGDRIAQMVISKVVRTVLEDGGGFGLQMTERGTGGFGSTGVIHNVCLSTPEGLIGVLEKDVMKGC